MHSANILLSQEVDWTSAEAKSKPIDKYTRRALPDGTNMNVDVVVT
jgi:hypothetical protein